VPTRLAASIAVVVLASVLLTGCGGSSSDHGSGTGATTQTESSPPAGAPVGAGAKSCETQAVDAGALRATGIPCRQARQVMFGWQQEGSCAIPSGASRGGCSTRSYRCQAVRTGRGAAVSCARPGESIAFIARRG
jgi:hypothetical protein